MAAWATQEFRETFPFLAPSSLFSVLALPVCTMAATRVPAVVSCGLFTAVNSMDVDIFTIFVKQPELVA